MHSAQRRFLTLLFALLATLAPAHAQSGLTRLGEFKVNTTTSGDQRSASVACAPDGRFVVAWTSLLDGSIYVQRYNSAGSPVGGETKANANTDPARMPDSPSVGMDQNGNFVVAWVKASDGTGTSVVAQRFNSNGDPVRAGGIIGLGEIVVKRVQDSDVDDPDVAMGSTGEFAICYTVQNGNSFISYVKFFTASASERAEVLLNPSFSPGTYSPAVAARPGGGFGVVWSHFNLPYTSIHLGLFAADGTPEYSGDGFPVTDDNATHSTPSITFAPDGSSVVTFATVFSQPSENSEIFTQRMSASGPKMASSARLRVNDAVSANRGSPVVAFDSPSTFVVGYRSRAFDGDGESLVARRFNAADNSEATPEFLVNTFTTGNQAPAISEHSIAVDASGNFVSVWTSDGQDGSSGGIYAEKFYQPNQGPPLTEFRVNTSTTNDQSAPEVAMSPDGRAVVVWESDHEASEGRNVYYQIFDPFGRKIGAERKANSFTASNQDDPSVAMAADGRFAIVWRSEGQDGDSGGIYGRRFTATGEPEQGGEIFVSSNYSAGNSAEPRIAMTPGGDFVVVWIRYEMPTQNRSIYARILRQGSGGFVAVDEEDGHFQSHPDVAITQDGFLVAWGSIIGADDRVLVKQYTLTGAIVGAEFSANAVGQTNDAEPAIAVRNDGSFVIAWNRTDTDVFAQRFAADRTKIPQDPAQFLVNTGGQRRLSAAIGQSGDMYFSTEGVDGTTTFRRFKFNADSPPGTPMAVAGIGQVNTTPTVNPAPLRRQRSLATDATGNYVIVWQSQNQDGSGYGIYARKVIVATPDVAAAPPMGVSAVGGILHVVFVNVPAGGTARWRLAGTADWRTTDLGGLEPGNYLVEFEPVSGVAPDAQIAEVRAAQTTPVTATYPATSGTTAPLTGAVSVEIKPDAVGQFPTVLNRGQWRPVGTTTWLNSGDTATGISVGAALIEFKTLPSTVNFDFVAPPSFAVNIAANETTRLIATYSKRTKVMGAQLPTVRTLAEVTGQGASATGPWQFAGQIQSDSGSGSGVAIDKRVVLTAAHVLYNDAALSFVTGVRWLHQRVRDEFEPAAQFPRGFFLASGYSAGRAVELENGTEPGEETPESQERDYAAMYFVGADCARGGASGYLKVDGPLDWLATAGQKTIIGYPVEAATGVGVNIAEADFGKLFSTPPLDVTLTKPYFVATPTTRVYRTTAIAGVGGMSGGPVCAQFFDGRFYPVGIYLGGTNASFVRGIDQPVIDLVELAAASARGEDNNTSPGVTKTSNDLANSGAPIGAVKVNLEKPSGVLNTAVKWRLRGQKTERANGETALGLPARREPYVVEFLTTNRALLVPAPREVIISDTTLREITGIFTEIKKPEFAFGALPFAGVDLAYSFPLTIEGGKLTEAPTAIVRIGATGGQALTVLGLSIVQDAKTKRYSLTGTPPPTARGEAELTFTAKNAGGTSTAKYFLTIVDAVTVSFNLLSDTLGEVSVSPPVDGRSRFKQGDGLPLALPVIPGQLYTLHAKAARGAVFAGWTGLSSEEGETLSIRFNTAGNLTANFGLNPFDTLAGNFGGLLQQDTFDAKTSGYVALKLGTTGSFTSAIVLGGARYSMKGKLNGVSEATVHTSRGKGKGTLTFSPRIVTDTDGVRLNGTLTATDGIAGSAPVRFTIAAPRQSYTKLNSAPMAGAWTLDLPTDPMGGSTYPKGHGYSAFTVDATGLVKGTIVLGDGTKTSASGYFASDNIWRFYAAPYKNTGAFIGELTIASNGAALTGTGTFEWQRSATAGTAFTGQTDAVASRWQPPATGILGWHLTIGTTVPITATVDLSDKNIFTLTNLNGSTSIKLTLAPKTGLLSGDYLNATGKRIPFTGALLQQQGEGFGLSPLPSQTVPVTLAP